MGPGMPRCRLAAPGVTSTSKSDDFIRTHGSESSESREGSESSEGVMNRKRGVMEMLRVLLIRTNSQSQVTAAKT